MNVHVAAVLLFVISAFGCWGGTDEGRRFKEALQLTGFSGPTNRYAWAFPSQIQVSNQIFRVGTTWQGDGSFEASLSGLDGTSVGSFEVRVASSAQEALDMICDRIMLGCSLPIGRIRSVWSEERDLQGNVLITSRGRDGATGHVVSNRSRFYRTYGNLYVRVAINVEKTSLSAWDFVLPLITGGLQNR